SGDFFYTSLRDVVSFASFLPTMSCPFGLGTFFNTDLARARGSHLRIDGRLTRQISVVANYTYDDTRVLAAPNAFDPTEIPGNRLLRRPVNSASFAVNGAFRRVQANLTALFVGRRTDSDFLGLGFTSNPAYNRFDAALSYRLSSRLSLIA